MGMLVIRGTRPVLQMLKISPAAAVDAARTEAEIPLQEWFGNLLWLKRRKCLLFTSRPTLFSFLVPGVTAAQLKSVDMLFLNHLKQALAGWGIEERWAKTLEERLKGNIVVSGTRGDRRVLGSMNDFARLLRADLEYYNDVNWERLPEAIRWINEAPMGYLNYDSPGYRMKEALQVLAEEKEAEH